MRLQNSSQTSNSGGGTNASSPSGGHEKIKTSSSVSSLDRLGLKSSGKSKGHGSKDKLDQNFKNPKEKIDRGSRERIADLPNDHSLPIIGGTTTTSINPTVTTTTNKSKKKKNSPMPIIHQHVANNNLIESRDIISNDENVLTDLTENSGSFDDPAALARRVSMMQDLQSHLQRLMRDKTLIRHCRMLKNTNH